ncbi:uncharacterized protein BXIN_2456 [Babesia sp. Xinjiang]|uniref:uncharacterized protein n=1 Tax=Babesia sp. Xinjiang TaxID=462227 RepID=UPI000A24D3C7|nr:uncharacterized protein BXIN_2456 [Babesia sp. Xinjiang]ORM41441.1 hypothetical protein BXIN_2456 [Babesia sp. Xinjiang]
MALSRGLIILAALFMGDFAKCGRQVHRKPHHGPESLSNHGNHQKTLVEKKPVSGDVTSTKLLAAVSATTPSSAVKQPSKVEAVRPIASEDVLRGREYIGFMEGASYAQLQPKKSLIGAIIIFAFYFLGTMLYNYIRKITEQDRVEQALREYEEEKEHYIETGETVDVAGSGI